MMFKSSLSVNVHMCGLVGEKRMFGARQGAKKWGQLIQSRGLVRGEVHILVQRAITLSKRALSNFFSSLNTHALLSLCVPSSSLYLNTFSPLQVENKDRGWKQGLFLGHMYVVRSETN